MTYNQKEHEKWIEQSKTNMACVLVLADFEFKKRAFLDGIDLSANGLEYWEGQK